VGTRTGLNGVRISQALQVWVESCLITDFSLRGITDERTVAGGLYVNDTTVRNCGGSGIVIIGTGATKATIDNCRVQKNGSTGIVVSGAANLASVSNTIVANNTGIGIGAEVGADMEVTNCVSVYNATGIDANGAGTEIRVSRTRVARNTTNGLGFAGGSIFSFGNNEVAANTGNNGPFTAGGTPLQ